MTAWDDFFASMTGQNDGEPKFDSYLGEYIEVAFPPSREVPKHETLAVGSYTPSQLGFDGFDLCDTIHVGKCGHRVPLDKIGPDSMTVAHAYHRTICVSQPWDVIWPDGASENMHHEYGHLVGEEVGQGGHNRPWYDYLVSKGFKPSKFSLYYYAGEMGSPEWNQKVMEKRAKAWAKAFSPVADDFVVKDFKFTFDYSIDKKNPFYVTKTEVIK